MSVAKKTLLLVLVLMVLSSLVVAEYTVTAVTIFGDFTEKKTETFDVKSEAVYQFSVLNKLHSFQIFFREVVYQSGDLGNGPAGQQDPGNIQFYLDGMLIATGGKGSNLLTATPLVNDVPITFKVEQDSQLSQKKGVLQISSNGITQPIFLKTFFPKKIPFPSIILELDKPQTATFTRQFTGGLNGDGSTITGTLDGAVRRVMVGAVPFTIYVGSTDGKAGSSGGYFPSVTLGHHVSKNTFSPEDTMLFSTTTNVPITVGGTAGEAIITRNAKQYLFTFQLIKNELINQKYPVIQAKISVKEVAVAVEDVKPEAADVAVKQDLGLPGTKLPDNDLDVDSPGGVDGDLFDGGVPGDLNGDGLVNDADVQWIKQNPQKMWEEKLKSNIFNLNNLINAMIKNWSEKELNKR